MSFVTAQAVAGVLQRAIVLYEGHPAAIDQLQRYTDRLAEPLRVALVGMVKAGKSTLLNAMLGEEIAPTDAGECTRIVTWYRYGDTPRVTLHGLDGTSRALRVMRRHGRLVFDLEGTPADDVERLVVEWPSQSLRELTLIDTPGIASLSTEVSARSTGFLLREDGPSDADVVIYLLRHLHEADLEFLERLRDRSGSMSEAVNALVVLARADEGGAGRIDALLSANAVADRYRRDDALRTVASGVVPVAGLLAQSARSLTRAEFAALGRFAELDRPEREDLLVSADRFVKKGALLGDNEADRAALVARFGIFGIRLSAVLVRSGVSTPKALADELIRHSGLQELLALVSGRFESRAGYLKADAALTALEVLLREQPVEGADELAEAIDMVRASSHERNELDALAGMGVDGSALATELTEEAARLLGRDGVLAAARLGLPEVASPEEITVAAVAAIARWRALSASPLADHATNELCATVVRSCEALVDGAGASSGHALAHLTLAPEPRRAGGQEARDQRRAG